MAGNAANRMRCLPGIVLVLLTGCATTDRNQIESSLATYKQVSGQQPPQSGYTIACPDLLEIHVANRDDLTFRGIVEPDGRINVNGELKLRVEGHTTEAVRTALAQHLNVPYDAISVTVIDHRSRLIFLTGSVKGSQQAVPYQGPEHIVDFLQRSGGLKAGAALNQIHVVRSQVAIGASPEVYNIDIEAILIDHDPRTNLVLQPYDQVYVGQTRRSALLSILPPWMRPVFKTACLFCPNPNALRLRP